MHKLALVAVLAVPALAFGQTRPAPKPPPPVTKINLDGDTVDGARKVPGGIIVLVDPQVKHSSIIQVRESFADRVLASSQELR
ncbi:MAG: hypothetical protein JST54_29580 [Deltaproteobacteria bacterium]|nr:hypothetical protein [Deltaproteobacteria bacterium]